MTVMWNNFYVKRMLFFCALLWNSFNDFVECSVLESRQKIWHYSVSLQGQEVSLKVFSFSLLGDIYVIRN